MSCGGFHPTSRTGTGFSAAGGDFRGNRLSLDSLLQTNPASTFFLCAEEGSSLGGGIHSGDILVVDRSARIMDGCLVVAVADGDMILRQVVRRKGQTFLRSGRSSAEQPHGDVWIWGRVVYVLHPVTA